MAVRVQFFGAAEPFDREVRKAEISSLQLRMLAGEDERRPQPAIVECMCQWRQFDCFGPGRDDQPNVFAIQPSP
jgi:hypothetical protein